LTVDPETGEPIGFAINYLKGKWLKIGMLKHPDDKALWRNKQGFIYSKSIVIEDVAGFFQVSFLDAMDGMQSAIQVSPEEKAAIDWGKPLRGDFINQSMDKILHYNNCEILILTRMMQVFREALAKLGLHPTRWHGPGVVAQELLKQKGILKLKDRKTGQIIQDGHYPEFLTATNRPTCQEWSHYAFSGGRIDLIMQGVHCDPNNPIYAYDICSAYPAVSAELPSMRGGEYKRHKSKEKLTLGELKEFVAKTNVMSMFEIDWSFKERTVYENETRRIPFFPLFYRCNGGIETSQPKGMILYPNRGIGRFYRDEVLEAINFCETFPDAVGWFECKGAYEFKPALNDPKDPSSYERPFGFVREFFDMRAAIVAETEKQVAAWKAGGEVGPKPYDILEKAIKLILNSLYGKTAQSIGEEGDLPLSSNPFYAGAITAGTRARLINAALHDPLRVIFFATDGIVSLGPLRGLETVEGKVLGKWECSELDKHNAAVFVHPGLYSFYDHKGKPHTKTRGFKIDLARDFFMRDVVKGWKRGSDCYKVGRRGKVTLVPKQMICEVRDTLKKGEGLEWKNKLSMQNTIFMTLGISVSAEDNWKKCGSWRTQYRDMNLCSAGTKRMLCHDKDRAKKLVFVAPADNGEIEQLSSGQCDDQL
jgi:hypothetical protein